MLKLRAISSDPHPLTVSQWQTLDESLVNAEKYLKDLIELALWGVNVDIRGVEGVMYGTVVRKSNPVKLGMLLANEDGKLRADSFGSVKSGLADEFSDLDVAFSFGSDGYHHSVIQALVSSPYTIYIPGTNLGRA